MGDGEVIFVGHCWDEFALLDGLNEGAHEEESLRFWFLDFPDSWFIFVVDIRGRGRERGESGGEGSCVKNVNEIVDRLV